MRRHQKYQINGKLQRDCEKCGYYGGMISKHYFLCTAEIDEYQTKIAARNVYDIKVRNKGCCCLFKPKEVTNVILSDYITMECNIEEDDQYLLDKE